MEVTNELQLQLQIFSFHWNNYPNERGRLFHVNQKARNAIEGNKMKALGVIPGVSDLIYLTTKGAVFIELKTATGTQSTAQKNFESMVKSLGYRYEIIRSLNEFQKNITTFIKTTK